VPYSRYVPVACVGQCVLSIKINALKTGATGRNGVAGLDPAPASGKRRRTPRAQQEGVEAEILLAMKSCRPMRNMPYCRSAGRPLPPVERRIRHTLPRCSNERTFQVENCLVPPQYPRHRLAKVTATHCRFPPEPGNRSGSIRYAGHISIPLSIRPAT